jgi:hypothetical protein
MFTHTLRPPVGALLVTEHEDEHEHDDEQEERRADTVGCDEASATRRLVCTQHPSSVHAVKHSDRASRSSRSGSNTCYARTRTRTRTTCTSTSTCTCTCTCTTWSCTSVVSPFL